MQAGRVFRVFVSSTFDDLKAERNALQERVFPRLRELCAVYGARFQAIDLRWGVSEEASRDQLTMPLCLGEIARCQQVSPRPNFVVLLGDRYGWRPLPYEIPVEEYEQILGLTTDPEDRALLEEWYRLDENAVPPVWVAQPRAVDYGEARSEAERQAAREVEEKRWEAAERRLRSSLCRVVDRVALSDEQRLKYQASATEQEIMAGALNVENAPEHVFCFFRSISGLPADGSARGFRDWDAHSVADRAAQERLEDLKARLRKHVPGNVFDYEAAWVGGAISDAHLEKLCDDVHRSIERVVLEELKKLEQLEASQQEIQAHEDFARDRTRHFRGRTTLLAAVERYVRAKDPIPLVIWGEPGTGKSSLLAKAIEQTLEAYPDAAIVQRFIGVTPRSSNARELLEDLCQQIGELYGRSAEEIPSDYQELVNHFQARLRLATPEQPLVLFLDALDGLRQADLAQALPWLPAALPDNVRLVVSLLPGDLLTMLRARLGHECFVELGAMPVDEAGEILTLWLTEAHRTLGDEQRQAVLRGFEGCPRPLYLKLAFEETRRWRSYDEPRRLGADVPGVIRELFARLSAEVNHGQRLVERSLAYLAAAKHGLTEDELLAVLSADETVMEDFRRRSPKSPEVARLPTVVWSRLFLDLEPYLAARSADNATLLGFYHGQLGEVVAQDYLAGVGRERHATLAEYFGRQELRFERDGERTANLRKLSELPFQQALAARWNELRQTLTEFEFLQAKVEELGPLSLADDYEHAFKLGYTPDCLRRVQGAVRLSAQTLGRDPTQLAAHLLGRLPRQAEPEISGLLEHASRYRGAPWLRPRTASLEPPGGPLLLMFTGHASPIATLAITSDGRRAVSGDFDGVLKVWDLEQGVEAHTLVGHETRVDTIVVAPDGKRAISGSADGTLRMWDIERGIELHSWAGYERPLVVSADGRRAISRSPKHTLVVWDLERGVANPRDWIKLKDCSVVTPLPDGRTVVTLQHGGAKAWNLERPDKPLDTPLPTLSFRAATSDGRFAFAGDGQLTLWDVHRGCERCVLAGHEWGVSALVVTADARRAVSGSADTTVRVWDLESCRQLAVLGHPEQIRAVAATANGRLVLSGTQDGSVRVWDVDRAVAAEVAADDVVPVASVTVTPDSRYVVSAHDSRLKVWDLERGAELRTLSGHTDKVTGLAATPDGHRVVSGASDGTIRVWDLERGVGVRCLVGHAGWVKVAVHPSGRHIVSASEDGTLGVWDLEREERLCTLAAHEGPIFSLAVTPDGRHAIAGYAVWSDTLKVWDLSPWLGRRAYGDRPALGRPATTLKQPGKGLRGILKGWSIAERLGAVGKTGVIALSVTPDGQLLVAASADGELRLWDLERREMVRVLAGHEDRVVAVATLADGQRVVSASADHTLRVWDLSTAEPLVTFGGDSGFSACAVAPHGNVVVAGDSAGRVHFFDDMKLPPSPRTPSRPSASLTKKQPPVSDTRMRASDRVYDVLFSVAIKGIPIAGQLGGVAGAIYGLRAGGLWKAVLYSCAGGIGAIVGAGLLILIAWLGVGLPLKLWDKRKGRRWSRWR